MVNLKFLVVGTGRCGTVYFANLLSSLGVPCGHESIFDFGGWENAYPILENQSSPCLSQCSEEVIKPDWVDVQSLVADSSYMAVPFLNYEKIKNLPIIHLVRHPLSVVSSFVKDFKYFDLDWQKNRYQCFIYQNLPNLVNFKYQIIRGFHYYVEWNKMIEKSYYNRNFIRCRIEEPEDIKKSLDFLNVKYDKLPLDKINSRKVRDKDFTWEEIHNLNIRNQVLNMAKRYGY